MTDTQGTATMAPDTGKTSKPFGGKRKISKDDLVKTLSDTLFGPKEVPCLKAQIELKGDLIQLVERAYLIYTEACNVKKRKPDFNEFIGLALEPGLRQVFKCSAADPKAAHLNAVRMLGDGAYSKKKNQTPVGETVE